MPETGPRFRPSRGRRRGGGDSGDEEGEAGGCGYRRTAVPVDEPAGQWGGASAPAAASPGGYGRGWVDKPYSVPAALPDLGQAVHQQQHTGGDQYGAGDVERLALADRVPLEGEDRTERGQDAERDTGVEAPPPAELLSAEGRVRSLRGVHPLSDEAIREISRTTADLFLRAHRPSGPATA
ncbi:hypothetical protein OK074_4170 [Actinobacteria bacterium OK074]|nr:hypothetical protein OK074_4170 [Actinobacteria bacterium OK074]